MPKEDALASRKPGPYAPLAANYADDEKIMEAGEDAELLYVRMLAYAARTPRTEGWISDGVIQSRLGIVPRPATGSGTGNDTGTEPGTDAGSRAAKLAEVGLIDRDGNGYRIRSWLKWNKSVEEMDRDRQNDRRRKAPSDQQASGTATGRRTGNSTGSTTGTGRTSSDQKQKQKQKQNHSPSESVGTKRARQLPDDWQPTDKHAAIAAERNVDVELEAEKFRDWCGATGRTYKNHDLAFNGWLRRAEPPRGNQQRPNRDAASAEALVQAHFDMQAMGGPQ